jgi:acetylglutamate kinase
VNNGFIPVIAPTGLGDSGETYNINADIVAGEVAAALKAEKLVLLTDVEGVINADGKLVNTMKDREVISMIDTGTISGGMYPKVKCCLKALNGGVKKAHIVDGRLKHAVLLEIFTDRGIGTEIVL